jgi:hypothetical protein
MRSHVLACAAVLLPAALSAQVKLEVSPFFTSYYATAYTRRPVPDSTERQEAGPGIGLNVTYRFTNLVGVQGSFAYIRSGIIPRFPSTASGTINTLQPEPGALTFASLRGTLQPRRSNYFVAAGVGIVQRSGKAWQVVDIDHLTDMTAVLGYGIRARVTPTFAFNIGVDANLYFSDMDGPAEAGGRRDYYRKRFQRDILVTIGIPYGLIER